MDIQELHDFKLGDAIKFHRKLNPKLWHDEQLDPIVRKQLLKIAEDFVEDLGVKLHVKDITVSGSNAAFTYTPHSDLDLHVVVDMKKLPDSDVYRELFQAKKTLYNEANSIKVRGIPIELYVQDSDVPVRSLGEYSVLNDHWIKIPKKQKASFDQMATKEKYEQLSELVKLAMKTRDLDRINKAIGIVHRYREAGLHNEGEFSPENLAYKAIRKQGGIDKLYDLRDKLHGQSLSIEEAASREDAIIKINKLRNTSGRSKAEIETINSIIDKMMKQYNIKPEELKNTVDPLSDKIDKARSDKHQAASALKGEWEKFKRGFFAEDEEELNEAYTSKQQVIDHFVKNRKYGVPSSTAARQGAVAWEKGWRGPKPKPPAVSTPPAKPWLPYKDDLDESLDSKPYSYQQVEKSRWRSKYAFETDKGLTYDVTIGNGELGKHTSEIHEDIEKVSSGWRHVGPGYRIDPKTEDYPIYPLPLWTVWQRWHRSKLGSGKDIYRYMDFLMKDWRVMWLPITGSEIADAISKIYGTDPAAGLAEINAEYNTDWTWDELLEILQIERDKRMDRAAMMEASDKPITERRDKMYQYIKNVLPKWPDYVLKDWIYHLAKGEHQAGVGWKRSPTDKFLWGFNKETILTMIAEKGLSPDTKWTLVPDMKFTISMFDPDTKQFLVARAGGKSTELVPSTMDPAARDTERHDTQARLAKQQGGVRKEPVLLVKKSDGYELLEGWHRTIQHFARYPDGYIGPAYVAVQGKKLKEASGYIPSARKVRYAPYFTGENLTEGQKHLNSINGSVPMNVWLTEIEAALNDHILIESIDEDALFNIQSLEKISAIPEVGESYIPIPIIVSMDSVYVQDVTGASPAEAPPKFLQLLNKNENTLSFKSGNEILRYPQTLRHASSYATVLLADSADQYEKIRMLVSLYFNQTLLPLQLNEASGYIPSAKEKNDPRFKTA